LEDTGEVVEQAFEEVSGNEIKFTAETKIPEGMTSPSGSPMRQQPPQEIVAKKARF
jgi:hypothetical protein